MSTLRQNAFRTIAATIGLITWATPALATADTQLITNCPQATETGGVILSNTVTECPAGGSYQYSATPQEPDFPYPWDDPYYGAALMIGGLGPMPVHGGAR